MKKFGIEEIPLEVKAHLLALLAKIEEYPEIVGVQITADHLDTYGYASRVTLHVRSKAEDVWR